ncbi:hydrocephalus-inducing protein-like [Ictalurus furcatus]|uniref:hydrocephalus-inducing protein-like n=1 Tax=Ictalurus furcatus TaxID=66913 RepID=UPI002350A7BF|nr:hydrocephalus-inducing protein-like [Ictalurus furcatus]XP_053479123.1 hydrocephalus-inducing protein-like [Ictalurus furcatus]XP_053479124.1 hydrocephalus-inducing protein-like [Ictalurus furcatus]
MEAEVHFCLHRDTKSTTFILDPLSMVLKPNERKELRVWAYPTTPGLTEDSVVCCIKDNPEPAVFFISCRGVRPKLEVECKQLNFDKIFLDSAMTRGRPRTRWRYYISTLAWERLGIPQSELVNVAREREVWGPLLEMPPPRPNNG